MKVSHKQSGFTLIELLVAMVIAGIIFSTVMVNFWGLIQTQNQLEKTRFLNQQTHFALSRVADRIRAFAIDYSAYEAGESCSEIHIGSAGKLCLGEGNELEFRPGEGMLFLNDQPLFSPDMVSVTQAIFQTSPERDPIQNPGVKSVQIQPKTTLFLSVELIDFPEVVLSVQTTISSRKY